MATALVAHSGGPTAVLNASLVGLVQEARASGAVGAFYGARFGIDGLLKEHLVDLYAEDPRALSAIGETPASVLGTSRRAVTTTDLERVLAVCRAHDVRWLFYAGGNGSMGTARDLARVASDAGQPLGVIGVPKTIDNDLAGTDHSPGFGSAARFFASAVRDIGADNRALPGLVQVVEVLGRHSGWLTAATALVRRDDMEAPHLVYVPERRLPLSTFLGDVERVFDRLGRCLVVVCEGQLDERGEPFGADVRMSSRGLLATNLGHRLAELITEHLGIKARGEKPGLLGRASRDLRSRVDWDEALMCGRAAVRAAMAGQSEVMVAIERQPGPFYASATDLVALDRVAGIERRLPPEWIAEPGDEMRPDFRTYLAPLVGPLDLPATLTLRPVQKTGAGEP